MTATDTEGEGLVKKETYWVTNFLFIAAELDRECTNRSGGRPWHRHVHLFNHKAHAARMYPPALVAAILRGLREQLRSTSDMMEFNYPVPEAPVIPRDIPHEAEEELESYRDDANWGWLDPKLVRAIKSYEVYVKRPTKECLEVTGKKPMPIRWVDTNKGDDENPEYRSRIVAKERKVKRDPNMPAIHSFAPMLALEMIKLKLSLAAMWRKTR